MKLMARGWLWVLRRLLREVRGVRVAAERCAEALERAQGVKRPATELPAGREGPLYVDADYQAKALLVETELANLLGRPPSESELEAALKSADLW